jgi:hypothetical protein
MGRRCLLAAVHTFAVEQNSHFSSRTASCVLGCDGLVVWHVHQAHAGFDHRHLRPMKMKKMNELMRVIMMIVCTDKCVMARDANLVVV